MRPVYPSCLPDPITKKENKNDIIKAKIAFIDP